MLDKWAGKIGDNKENLISSLIVLRIGVVNVICPHVGISIVPFWISTFLGIIRVTVIHTTIGGGLDEMTSADDFHLISWRNFFGLAAVVVGVMIPVGLRYWFRREVDHVADVEDESEVLNEEGGVEDSDRILAVGPRRFIGKKTGYNSESEDEDDDDDDDDDDVILEAGPR